MDPSFKQKHVSVIKKYPTYRDYFVNGCWKWIEGRVKDDNAHGYWRVHDRLYDLTEFVKKHPGGEYWLEFTRGTDITEAFESHHISPKAGELLNNFFVADATESRNYHFTYDENGFYKTLKRRIGAKLKTFESRVTWKSRMIHDVNLFVLFVAAILMIRTEVPLMFIVWTLLASQCLAWSANFSHNFLHQADNWRMYTANISLVTWRDYRASHVLSHHMYPNTYADLEVSAYDPYFKWIPTQTKSLSYKVLLIFTAPVFYLTFFHHLWRFRYQGLIWAKEKVVYWDELLTLAIPTAMLLFGKEQLSWSYLGEVYMNWNILVILSEIFYGVVFFNRGHHGTNLIHQNDEIKSFDFGEFQLSTTADRVEANRNIFTSMAYYGEQVLHHLFPTLDHSILPQLKGTLLKTCKEFDVDLQSETTMLEATLGQMKQLFRSEIIKCS